jgi:hypothetical protein
MEGEKDRGDDAARQTIFYLFSPGFFPIIHFIMRLLLFKRLVYELTESWQISNALGFIPFYAFCNRKLLYK